MASDKRDQLYSSLIGSGKVSEDEIGSLDEFKNALKDEQSTREFYKNLSATGLFDEDEIGNEDDFYGSVSDDFAKPSTGDVLQKSMAQRTDPYAQVQQAGRVKEDQKRIKAQGYTPTPEEMAGFQQTINNVGRSVDAGMQRFDRRTQNLEKRQGLSVPQRINLGETNNLREGEQYLNPETGQLENTYITSSGNEYDSKAMAEQEQQMLDEEARNRQWRKEHPKDALGQDINEQIANLEKQREAIMQKGMDEAKQEMEQRPGIRGAIDRFLAGKQNVGPFGPTRTYAERASEKHKAELSAIEVALQDLKDAKTRIERSEQLEASSDFLGGIGIPFTKDWFNNWKNFGYGIWDAMDNLAFNYTGSRDVNKANVYLRIKDKMEKGEELTDQETAVALAGMSLAQAQQVAELPHGYTAGETTLNMAPFMFQMAGNPASGTGKAFARQAVRKFGRDGIKAVSARVGARVLGNIAEGTVLANTFQAPATIANVMQRYTGDSFEYGDDGKLKIGYYDTDKDGNPVFVEGGKGVARSIWEGEASQIIENFTELGFGGNINKFLGKIASSGVGQKMGLGYLSDLVGKIGATPFARNMKNFMKRTHWDGMIEEPLEEEYGIILNSLLTGDNSLSDLWDSEQQMDIFAGTMWFGGMMAAMNTAAYPYYRRKVKQQLNQADVFGQVSFGDEWAVIKDGIDEMPDNEIANYLYDIKGNDAFSNDQKAALFAYVSRLKQYQGASTADMLMRIEGNLSKEETDVRNAYDRGTELTEPQDMNEAKMMMDYQRERLGEFVDDTLIEEFENNPLGALQAIINNENWTNEEKQVAMDYVNARMTYEGMIDRVNDDIDSQIAASDAMIDKRANREDPSVIVPATLTDDSQVSIISGNVIMLDDGTGVDRQKSIEANGGDGMILTVDDSGKVEAHSLEDFRSVDEAIPVQQMKDEAAANIRQVTAQTAADNIDGILPFAQGDQYTILGDDGQQHNVEVFEDQGDGTVAVFMDGTPQAVVMPKEQLQAMNDAYLQEQLALEEAEKQTMQPAGETAGVVEEQPAADAEQQKPVSALDKIPVSTDGNGQPILNKKGKPQRQWHKASVEDATDALIETAQGNMLDAKNTAGDLVNQSKEKLEKIRKQKPKGEDPEELAESRAAIRRAEEEQQAIIKQWQNVGQEIKRRMDAEAAARKAEIEAAKSEEQRQREAEEARIRKEQQDEADRQKLREQVEKETAERTREYEPLVKARRELAGDADATDILNDTEPRSLEEWVSHLLSPHSFLWLDASESERGLQTELGLKRADMQRFMTLFGNKENGAKPFGKAVLDIYEALPEGMKNMYTDEDVARVVRDMFQSMENSAQMMHLTEYNRIEQARQLAQENERRDAEAEMDAWAEAYHLTPEERETFEDYMQQAPSEPEQEIINNIIADEQFRESLRSSQAMAQQPVSGTDVSGIEGGESQVQQTGETPTVGINEEGSADEAETGTGQPSVADNNVPGAAQDVFTKAEQVTKEQKVTRQAKKVKQEQPDLFGDLFAEPEPAKEESKAQEPGKRKEPKLRPATEADLESEHPIVYLNGHPYNIIAVMRSGEQISATQFSKPKVDSVMLTNGKSVKLEDLMVEDENASKEKPKPKTPWWNDSNRPQSIDPSDYHTYMTDEARKYFASHPTFGDWKRKDIAFVTAAVWDGVVIPYEALKDLPEIVAAEQVVKDATANGVLQISEEERDQHAQRLLDAEHGSAIFENGKIKKVNGVEDFSGPVRQERKALVIIGYPAAGKSSVFANRLSNELGARIIDSDTVKPWLKGFDGGNGAGYVQEASSEVAERALDIAVGKGDNIILPRIGGGSVIALSAALKLAGYDVQLYFNDVATVTSVDRATSRFAETGRYLSLQYLTSKDGVPSNNFINFAEKNIGDYINELSERKVQELRGRLRRLLESETVDGTRLWQSLAADQGGYRTLDEYVSVLLEPRGTGVTSGTSDLIFSYSEWKSNDVAFGEKPKEIWNSKSGKPMPNKEVKDNGVQSEQRLPGKPSSSSEGEGQEGRGTGRVREGLGSESNRDQYVGPEHSVINQPAQTKQAPKHNNKRNNSGERGKDYAPTSPKARFNANVEAIKMMRELIDQGIEAPTKDQMEVLRQYSGWGGLGTYFNDESSAENKILHDLLDDDEYNAAALSIKTAYYTPAYIIDSLWDIARAMGFKGGNMLEGSAGIGNIIAQMPRDLSRQSDIEAVEIDKISGNILKLLYPDAKVHIQGFQDTVIRNGSVDLAITNVPFAADLSVIDKVDKDLSRRFRTLHDFCIAKNIRKLKEGGIGIFISTSGTLDKSTDLRAWITDEGQADVVGAFRLNNETFGGAKVTSDIIVVRKRVNGVKSSAAIDVSKASPLRVGTYEDKYGDEHQTTMVINDYFKEHPEMMAGEMAFGYEKGDTYRPGSYALYPVEGKNQEKMLAKFVKSMGEKADVSVPQKQPQQVAEPNQLTAVKEGRMLIDDNGRICVSRYGEAVPLGLNDQKVKGQTKQQCFKDYQAVQAAVDDVLQQQLNDPNDEALKPKLAALNKAYDLFTKRYGTLHKNTAISFLRNDIDFPSFQALELYREEKDINGKVTVITSKPKLFSERVIGFKTEPQPKTVKDAVIASIFRTNGIDLDWITSKLNEVAAPPHGDKWTTEDVRKGILVSRLGFEDPSTGQLVIRYKYLSGNVREKLAIAEQYNTEGETAGRYAANVEELKKAVPMDIPAHLIDFSLGSSWIPVELYKDFVKETFDLNNVRIAHIEGSWAFDEGFSFRNEKNRSAGVYSEKFRETIYGHQLFASALNNRPYKVSKQVTEGWGSSKTTHTEVDQAATQACNVRIDEIKAEFREWTKKKMQDDPELARRIEKIYNEKFNALVPMEVGKEFLPERFEGANTGITLRPHQKLGAIKGLVSPVMLAHEVGTGKSFTLITTAMEMRRLGTAKKPMIVVQNATVAQLTADAKLLYPNAKVLSLSEQDRDAEGRRAFYAKIKYNDWDIIIVPQSTFERIPDSPERELQFIQEKIDEKKHVIEAAQAAGVDSRDLDKLKRELEKIEQEYGDKSLDSDPANASNAPKRKKKDAKREAASLDKAETRAKEQLDRAVDDVQFFDDLGVDALLVDEAHEYKHLGFQTSMGRGIKGIDPSYSKKCAGLYNKTRSVYEKAGWKNVVFATGTPISNTAAEIWTFMKYLMPADIMRDNDIYYFDDFVHNFGNVSQMLEFTTSGKFKENTRFAAYVNKPELIRIWSQVADTVRSADTEVKDKEPEEEGGKDQDVFLPQSPSLIRIMAAVRAELERFENMTGQEKKENSSIPLTMYGIAKRAAIDPRLVDAEAPDEPLSKTNAAVKEILKDLKATQSYKGTVAVFCDNQNRLGTNSTGKKVVDFNIYDDMKEKLIKAGVPEKQIAIVKSGMSITAKQKIFDAVNSGDIRVVLGSTQTLGTGVNMQERLHLLIHMDAPDRPMDYTQRNGRIKRQGNLHKQWGKTIRIVRFGVEDSLDVTAYQRLKTKSGFIDSIMNGKAALADNQTDRTVEEEEEGLFDNPVAVLSGSQYALKKNQAERELRKYQGKKAQWEADQIYVVNQIRHNANELEAYKANIDKEQKQLERIKSMFPDGTVKTITVEGVKIDMTKDDGAKKLGEAIKEKINDPVNAIVKRNRENAIYNDETLEYTVGLDGHNIKFTVKVVRESVWESGKMKTIIHKYTSYSWPELNMDSMDSSRSVRDYLDEIIDQVVTGQDSQDRIDAMQQAISRINNETEQIKKRVGQPFQFGKELEEAEKNVEEYTALMKKEMEEKEAKYAEQQKEAEADGNGFNLNKAEEESEDDDLFRYGDEDEDVLLAPNGKPSNLSPYLWSLVRTPEFKAWFGDWENDPEHASKVVDENGEPKVMYHSTNLDWVNKGEPFWQFYEDSHFGTLGQANDRVRSNDEGVKTYEVFLNIRNPQRRADADQDYLDDKDMTMSEFWKQSADRAKSQGYDGIVYLNEYEDKKHPADSWIAFRPEQVKSATDNNGEFDSFNPDIRYRLREDEPPKKTGIGYKVFVLKDGQLYPPMVANPNGAATPVGEWLDADAAPIAGTSKTGRPQVKAGGKGTQGGSGQLAYRPGWHLGTIPYALQFNRKDENGEKTLFPKNFVWAEVEYADDVDYQKEAHDAGVNENGKYQHSLAGLKYVPVDGSYRYRTNPDPNTDEWIITGAMKVNRILKPSEVDEMVRAAGREPQPRQEGAVTDAEVEALNAEIGTFDREGNPVTKSQGTRQLTAKEQKAREDFARRQWRRAHEVAQQTIDTLNIGDRVQVFDSIDDVPGNEKFSEKKRRAKGWYERSTGKIYIVLGNHNSPSDVRSTILHEAVAHYGLRQLFGKNFDQFLDNVYRLADSNTRAKIVELAKKHKWDFRTATEEYLARLAEDTDFERAMDSGWWQRIKDAFLNMLKKVGLADFDQELTDNELRYILWRSYENLAEPEHYRNVFAEAKDVAMQTRLKVGNHKERDRIQKTGRTDTSLYDPDRQMPMAAEAQEDLHRDGDGPGLLGAAKRQYEKEVSKKSLEWVEAWQDSMVALKTIQDAIAVETGKVAKGAEDAYHFENRMHGAAKNKSEQFDYRFYRPMLKAFNDFCKDKELSETEGMEYLIAKSGLERNMYYAFRDAIKEKITEDAKRQREQLEKDYAKKRISEDEYKQKKSAIGDYERNGVDNAMQMVRNTLAWKRAKEDYDNGTISYTELLRRRESIIMSHAPKYEKYAHDYSGLTETFAESMYDAAQEIKKQAQAAVDPEEKKNLWSDYNAAMKKAYEQARQVADDTVFGIEDSGKKSVVNLWSKINAANEETLKNNYRSGMMSRDTYNKVSQMFDYYIPLRGWEEDKAADVYTYMGKENVFNPAVKKTWGRTSKADNPLAYIGNIAVSTILSGYRNQMKQHFLNYVMNNPTSLVSISESWYENVGTPENPIWILRSADTAGKDADEVAQIVSDFNDEMAQKQRDGKAIPVTGRLRLGLHATKGQKSEHVVEVQRGGHTYQMYINGNPKAAQALNGSAARAVSRISHTWGGQKLNDLNRSMAMFFTSKNPAFVVSNLSRDLNMAGASVAVNEGPAYNAQFIANVMRVLAPRMGESSKRVPASKQPTGLMPSLMRKWQKGTLDTTDETERLFKEFMDEGGETGFVNMLSVDSFKEKMQKEIIQLNGSNILGNGVKETTIGKSLRLLGETFEFYNRCAEDATRFIVYMTSRQMGKNVSESIADAKDVTLNFNRKGTGAKGNAELRDLFIFANPAIQALANMYRMAKGHPLKLGSVALGFMAMGALMPVINQWLLNMFSGDDGDDDDNKDAYWNLPPWVRKNNLIFWVPGTKYFITIPLSQEFRVFYGVGEMVSSAIMEHPNKNIGMDVIESVADLVPINPTGNGGNLAIDFAPTGVQPFMQLFFNKDFTGKPIWKENMGNKYDPMFTKAYASTPKWMTMLSEGINSITGGDEDSRGWLDKTKAGYYVNNPAVWNHLLQGYFGGMYNTIAKAADLGLTVGSGETPNAYQIPVVNRFVNSPWERDNAGALGEDYWELVNDNEEFMHNLRKKKKRAEAGDAEAKAKLQQLLNSDDYQRSMVISQYKDLIDNLRSQQKETSDKDELADIKASISSYKNDLMDELKQIDGGSDPLDVAKEKYNGSQDMGRRKAIAKRIAKIAGASQDVYGKKSDKDYANIYIELRTPEDIYEDGLLYGYQEQMKDAGNTEMADEISKERQQIRQNAQDLDREYPEDNAAIMDDIRQERSDLIRRLQNIGVGNR